MTMIEATGLGRWRQWLVSAAEGRVLDVGCGTGRNLSHLPAGARGFGIDPCAETLARARARRPDCHLVRARAEALPFRDGAFDTALSGLVFCSVAHPQAGLREVARVLRPGGTLRMLEHVRSRHRWQARLQDLAQPIWTRFTGGCHPNRDTEAAVRAAGFEVAPDSRRARGTMRRLVACPPAPARRESEAATHGSQAGS